MDGLAPPMPAPPDSAPAPAASGPGGPSPLTDVEFSAAVVAVTTAFGDPTRRRIYLFARERAGGVTAGDVAEHFALHPNVARHHLDKLAAGGYLEVFLSRSETGRAGRPSKGYRVSGQAAGLEVPVKGSDLLITLLGRSLALLPPEQAEAMAEEVGEAYGRDLASQMSAADEQRSFRSALHAVADALTAHGFAAHAENRGTSLLLIKDNCPFFDTAKQHPVICAVDRGMVKGMLAGLYGGETVLGTESSRALGDDACITIV
ncbi:MAG TPA: helix-turn-helix domain-containing protein [Acidimicrobiales bacterium]|nr:helix-turn-helix domain-containing protein [Acidimicrobiales bacterium]